MTTPSTNPLVDGFKVGSGRRAAGATAWALAAVLVTASVLAAEGTAAAAPRARAADGARVAKAKAKPAKSKRRKAPARPAAEPDADEAAAAAAAAEWSSDSATASPSTRASVERPETAAAKDASSDAGSEAATISKSTGRKASGGGAAMLDLAAGPMFSRRRLTYVGDTTGNLRAYQLSGAPALGASVTIFPSFLRFGSSVPLHVGVAGSYQKTFIRSSVTSDGSRFDTNASAWSAGARVRTPLGPVELALGADFGARDVVLSAAEDGTAAPFPDVRYRFVRASLETRIDISALLSAQLSAGVMPILDAGEIGGEGYFPHASALGLEGSAGIGYALGHGLEARATAGLTRIAFEMNNEVGDSQTAESAVDQFLSGCLWLAWRV